MWKQTKAEGSLPSAFVIVGRFAPDEERLVLSKPVVQFSFTYGVSRDIFYICLKKIHFARKSTVFLGISFSILLRTNGSLYDFLTRRYTHARTFFTNSLPIRDVKELKHAVSYASNIEEHAGVKYMKQRSCGKRRTRINFYLYTNN